MKHDNCRLCGLDLPAPFLSLGEQPLANNLLTDPNDTFPTFPLELTKCRACHLVQLTEVVPPDILFRRYLYTPSQSASFRAHFAQMAEMLTQRLDLQEGDLVCDIGSNDGLLLSHFMGLGMQVVGVEPALNLAEEANRLGIPTIPAYLSDGAVEKILLEHGRPRLVTATNVFAHVDDVGRFTDLVGELLSSDGTFVIEVPSLVNMLQNGTFDLCYQEHLSYWTLHTLRAMLLRHSFTIYDAEPIPTHGGSLRVCASKDVHEPTMRYLDLLAQDEIDPDAYEELRGKATHVRYQLQKMVERERGVVAGFTAPAKATVLLNYCNFTNEDIAYVVDDSPLKQGKYIPGTRIPVVNLEYMQANPPATVIIFAWNIADDIIPKLVGVCRSAIVPFPTVHRVSVSPASAGAEPKVSGIDAQTVDPIRADVREATAFGDVSHEKLPD